MPQRFVIIVAAGLALSGAAHGTSDVAASSVHTQSAITASEADRLSAAARVLQDVPTEIPRKYWDGARCVAVIPDLKKGAFIFGGEYGKGVMSCRSSGGWSAPVFLQLAKGSWGLQAGGELVDLILLVMNERGVQKLLENKVNLGADASVAAGPVGAQGQVGTDAYMTAEILSYSRARGLFAGIDVSGGVLRPDEEANQHVYGAGATPRTILASREISAPTQASAFLTALNSAARGAGEAAPSSAAAAPSPSDRAGTTGVATPSTSATAAQTPQHQTTTSGADRDLRAQVIQMQQTLDRMLADAVSSPAGTTGTTGTAPESGATLTVDRAKLLQLRQQVDALLLALERGGNPRP